MDLRAKILSQTALPTERVEVPEWGLTLTVRGLSGAERDAFEATTVELRGKRAKWRLENLRARLVALTVVDDQGQRVFFDDDVAELGRTSAVVLDRLFEVARRLSGIGDRDLEELQGN